MTKRRLLYSMNLPRPATQIESKAYIALPFYTPHTPPTRTPVLTMHYETNFTNAFVSNYYLKQKFYSS